MQMHLKLDEVTLSLEIQTPPTASYSSTDSPGDTLRDIQLLTKLILEMTITFLSHHSSMTI